MTVLIAAYQEAYNVSYPPDILGPQDSPKLTSLSPGEVNSDDLTLVTITGTDFHHNAIVFVDDVARGAHWISDTQVSFNVRTDTNVEVAVRNGDSQPSNVLTLNVVGVQPTEEEAVEGVDQAPADEQVPLVEAKPPRRKNGNGNGNNKPRTETITE